MYERCRKFFNLVLNDMNLNIRSVLRESVSLAYVRHSETHLRRTDWRCVANGARRNEDRYKRAS